MHRTIRTAEAAGFAAIEVEQRTMGSQVVRRGMMTATGPLLTVREKADRRSTALVIMSRGPSF